MKKPKKIQLEVELGIDVSAYKSVVLKLVPHELALLKANPAHFFKQTLDRSDYTFKPNWETEDGFRVVGASIGNETIVEDVWFDGTPVYEVGLSAMGIIRTNYHVIRESDLPVGCKELLMGLLPTH